MSNHILLYLKGRKQRSIVLSSRKDLTLEDIKHIAVLLILDNANSTLEDYKLNCNKLLLIQRLASIEECVNAVLDKIDSLPKHKPNKQLLF